MTYFYRRGRKTITRLRHLLLFYSIYINDILKVINCKYFLNSDELKLFHIIITIIYFSKITYRVSVHGNKISQIQLNIGKTMRIPWNTHFTSRFLIVPCTFQQFPLATWCFYIVWMSILVGQNIHNLAIVQQFTK